MAYGSWSRFFAAKNIGIKTQQLKFTFSRIWDDETMKNNIKNILNW